MDQHHSPALDRLIRRQRVAGEPGTLPNAAAAGDSTTTTSSAAAAATTTTTTPAPTTTSAAPIQSTTTTTSAVPETTSSSLVPSSSSTTTSSTTTTPVQESSSSVAPSSSTTTTTTTTPSATSSTTSSTTTTTARSTISEQADTATSTSQRTTVVVVSASAASSSGTASLASATAAPSPSSNISTGGVIGIVAGAVVGVVFVAALVAFLFKKYSRKDDDDQISPFDKDEFRRASVMLDDDDAYPESYHGGPGGGGMGHSPQMSEYSMSNVGVGAVLPGLARGGTLNSPRPPTGIMNHYQHQQMMPSFQPGQVVPTSSSPPLGQYGQPQYGNHSPPLGGTYAPMDPYGGYPQHPQPAQFADQTGGLSSAAAGHWNGVAPPMNAHADLSRNNSQMSSYSQFSDGGARQIVPPALRPGQTPTSSSHHGHPDERPLSLVHEDDEPYSPSHGSFSRHQPEPIEYIPERSGTPTNSNVQQTFFGAKGVTTAETGNDWEQEEREREQARRLSIRNGGLDSFDDPYDGMH